MFLSRSVFLQTKLSNLLSNIQFNAATTEADNILDIQQLIREDHKIGVLCCALTEANLILPLKKKILCIMVNISHFTL